MMYAENTSAITFRWWLIGCLVLYSFTGKVLAQAAEKNEPWKLETAKNGIRVFSRRLTDSKFKEIKVNCDLNGTLSQLVAYISDIHHYPEVVYRSKEAYVIRRDSDTDFYFYNETDMPWPVANRDMVVRMNFRMDRAARTLVVLAEEVKGLVPEKKGVVRLPLWRTRWTIQELASNRLRVEYRIGVDPGGELPAWLVNTLASSAPYQSFLELEKNLQRPWYQNRTFSFL